jgi:uncharacterized protein (DUF302 family)
VTCGTATFIQVLIRSLVAGIALLLVGWTATSQCLAASGSRAACVIETYVVDTRKPYQDVVDDLEYAISERNFRITGRNTIGAGIRARGHARFPLMEIIHFCSLEYAREILEIDPDFLSLMPCRIAVRQAGSMTRVTAVLLPTGQKDARARQFVSRLNREIREIVDSAKASP